MLRKLLVFLWIARFAFALPTGHYPSALIEDSVNLITGQCSIFTQDMEIRGAESLTINRLFVNGTTKKKYAGWKFMPHLRLYRFTTTYQYVYLYDHQGNKVYFDIPRGEYKRGKPIDLVPDFESTFKEQSYAIRRTISGKNNLKNIKVHMTGNRNYIYVTSADGCNRVYKECEDLEHEKVRKYLLQYEDLPSGNRIKYSYDKDYKIQLVELINPKNNKILSQCKFTKFTDDYDAPNYCIEASDGQRAAYFHEHHDVNKARYEYTLAHCDSTEKPSQRYSYTDPTNDRGRLIQERTFGDHTTLAFTYFEKGKNPTKYHNVILKEKDPRIDRVKEIKRNSEVIYTFEYDDRSSESGWTKVHDAEGNITVYFYSHLHQIERIERYDHKGHLQNIELYVYGKGERRGDLLAAIIQDCSKKPLIAKTYEYDDWGNIIEETVWGNITGRSQAELKLNLELLPFENGVEKATKKFRHSQDGRHLLLYEMDENGLETFYNYYDNSYLLKSKFIKHHEKILRRTFYRYNDDNILIQEIHDDGSSEHLDSFIGVTEQHIYRTHPFQDGPFFGMPEWIEESYIDLNSKQEMPVVKTQVSYKPNRKVAEKKVYDNQNALVYTLSYNYDEHNNLISETNPLGKKATATYNKLRKKETFTDFDQTVEHTFEYDTAGRLWKTTHTDGNPKTEWCKYNPLDQCIQKVDIYDNATRFIYCL